MDMLDIKKLDNTLSVLAERVAVIAQECENNFPYSKDFLSSTWFKTEWCDWSGGHWVGLLLETAKLTGHIELKERAIKLMNKIEPRLKDHDIFLGFIFYYSFAKAYDLYGDKRHQEVALKAADMLVSMYNRKIGLIPIGKDCKVLGTNIRGDNLAAVDGSIIPNILLFWAYEKTENKKYFEIALKNLDRSIEIFMRKDYSVIHMFEFDPNSATELRKWNNLGYNDSSIWTRGQAWFILALSYAFKYTHNYRYREIYRNALGLFLSHTSDTDLTPYYDLMDPRIPDVPLDTSALSIIAEASMIMAEEGFGNSELINKFVSSLLKHISKANNGILEDGCFDYNRNFAVKSDLIFSDYYFINTLIKYKEFFKI